MSRGAKPNLDNVSTFPGSDKPQEFHEAKAAELRPGDLSPDEIVTWNRIAPELSKVGRLTPLFVDVVQSYCEILCRLKSWRKWLDDNDWVYTTEGRHGKQHKSRPEVAQLNDDWRKFRSLQGDLGLSPSAERGLKGIQGDLFGSEFEEY